ncbi:MAG TPA: hypothetical protein VFO40_28505 [Chthoniobacterales bacterium]|nr:hypothetical protein [Chthoniobacterales bacterium]
MKTSAAMRSVPGTTLVLATAFSVFGLVRTSADSLPTFSDPVVNTFVKTYSQFVDSYVDAAKTGDSARLATIQAKESELQQQLGQLTQPNGKVKQEEGEKFQNFLATYKEKILPYYRYSAADVNTFVAKYAQFVESYVAGTKTGDAAKLAATREKEFQQQAIQAAGKLKKVDGKLFQEEALFPEFLTTYTQKIASYIALSYKFIDESINTFADKYSKFADDYVAALEAAKSGDTSKLTSIQSKATEIQAQAAPIAKKVKDGESAIFQSFVAQEIAKISDASK